jgi:hypothetical protein
VFVLLGRGLCDGPIPRPEESYRLGCVLECYQMKLRKPTTPAVNKEVEEGRTKKERKKIMKCPRRYWCKALRQLEDV